MKGRNVGGGSQGGGSPNQGLTSAKDLTIILKYKFV